MSDAALAVRLGGYNLRGYLRSPRTLVFAVAMPVGFLVLFNSVFGHQFGTTRIDGRAVPLTAFYTAGLTAYAVALNSFSAQLIGLVTDREGGRLKRFRGTPLPPWVFFAGQLLFSLAVTALIVVGLVLIAALGYGVHVRAGALPALALYVVLGVGCLATVAIALTRWVTTTDMASSVGPFAIVALAFVSGVFLPVALLPHALYQVAEFFPLAPLARGIQAVLTPGAGAAVRPDAVLTLLLWWAAATVVAVRRFAWTPWPGAPEHRAPDRPPVASPPARRSHHRPPTRRHSRPGPGQGRASMGGASSVR